MEENQILSALDKDEKLLWSGRPGKFETLDAVHKPKLIKNAVISVLIAAAILVLYFILAKKNGVGIKSGLIVIVAAIAVISPLSVFTNAAKLRRGLAYAVTDKRILLEQDGVKGIPFAQITEAKLITDGAGVSSLLCGRRAAACKPENLRSLAVTGAHMNEDNTLCDSLVFYAVEEPEKLRAVLKPYLNIN